MRRLVVAAGAAVLLAGVAIAMSASSGTPKAARPAAVPALFTGIPERDGVLGDPAAPITITEFVDLQCPVCAQASDDVLPGLIERYVRTGKVKLALRTLYFIGPDSERGARVAAAAERQGRLWPFVHAFFSAQGAENSGYATDEFLTEAARAAGADAATALGQAGSEQATATLNQANADAARYGVNATPTFLIEGENAPASMLPSGLPSARDLDAAIESALRNSPGENRAAGASR